VREVNSFIEENAQFGYVTKEDFVQDAVRSKLALLSERKISGQG